MEQLNILAIDGGNEMSGYCVLADDFTPMEFGKVANDTLLQMLPDLWERYRPLLAIEKFESYGMPVGREVFDSCVWNGRFIERFMRFTDKWLWIKRKDEKLMICGTTRANDSNIRHALIERFAKHDLKNGKGTKNNPDFFYGFKADIWSAFAIGYTAFLIMEDGHKNKMSKEEYEAAMLAVAKDFGAKKITSAEALKKRREIRQKFSKRGDVNAGKVG